MKKIYITKDRCYNIADAGSCTFLIRSIFGFHCSIAHDCVCEGWEFPHNCPLEDAE